MKYTTSILFFLFSLILISKSNAAFFLPDPNLGIGDYRQPRSIDAIKSLSIYTPHVYISNHEPVRVVILYGIAKGKQIESLRLFESKTHRPLHYFGIIDTDDLKGNYKLSWLEKLKKFASDVVLLSQIAVTNQHMAERYIFLRDGTPDLTVDLCVELNLTSGEGASTCT